MGTQDGIPGRTTAGEGLTRPILAYLVIVIVGVWVFYAVEDLRQGGDPVRAAGVAAGAFLGVGLGMLALASLLLIPPLVLTIELVHRSGASSRAARSVLGAVSWAGWGLAVAIILAVASRLILVPGTLAGDLVLFAAAGAGFSLLAFDGEVPRPGRALILVALAVTASVVLGSLWMAGRWGGTV